VASGVTLLILDDSRAFAERELFIDAHLALAAVDQGLNAQIDLTVSTCTITTEINVERWYHRRPGIGDRNGESASSVQHYSQIRPAQESA
jgi:hypothetical protein